MPIYLMNTQIKQRTLIQSIKQRQNFRKRRLFQSSFFMAEYCGLEPHNTRHNNTNYLTNLIPNTPRVSYTCLKDFLYTILYTSKIKIIILKIKTILDCEYKRI